MHNHSTVIVLLKLEVDPEPFPAFSELKLATPINDPRTLIDLGVKISGHIYKGSDKNWIRAKCKKNLVPKIKFQNFLFSNNFYKILSVLAQK